MRPEDNFEEMNFAELGRHKASSSSSNASASSGSTKIVVADTSPLNYLVQIECDFLLPLLYRRVITPPIVVAELTHTGAPPRVAKWAAEPPVWLEVIPLRTQPDEKLYLLDGGERDAIQLAIELDASEVLIDEFKGRREAQSRGLSIVGTLGILIAGERDHLVSARDAFERLTTQTNIHIAPQLRHSFLESLRPSIES